MGASTRAFRNPAEALGGRFAAGGVERHRMKRGRWAALGCAALASACAAQPANTLTPNAAPALAPRAAPQVAAPPAAAPAGEVAPPQAGASELNAGDAALDAGRLDVARQQYERARALDPAGGALGLLRVRFAELGLGSAYADAPDHPELVRLLSELDALLLDHPRNAAAQLERARWLIVLGDAERALQAARVAVQLAPRQPEPHSVLGVAQLATGHAEAALEELETADRLGPNDPDRLVNLGTAHMLRGRVGDAIATFGRAAALAPDDPRTHGDLGAALLADGQIDRALPHLLRAAELAPTRATFLTNLGYASQRRGELERAEETQRRALALDPTLGSAWINLGNTLAERGDYAAAAAALRRAEALDPSDPRPKASLRDLAELEARSRPSAP